MLFVVTILLADGRVVAQSDEVTLEPGEFHSFDFKPADLPLTGELSGRRQGLRLSQRQERRHGADYRQARR